jgi:hypothetical protein
MALVFHRDGRLPVADFLGVSLVIWGFLARNQSRITPNVAPVFSNRIRLWKQ